MKSCNYCGQENDDGAGLCKECGTRFPVGRKGDVHVSREGKAAPGFPSVAAGGIAVVLICAGIVVASRRLLPGIYAFSLLAWAWMIVMGFVALALTLYAGSICCRTQVQRAVFTLAVLALLAAAGAVLLPGETGLGSRGSPAIIYGGSALMICAGAIALARIAKQTKPVRTIASSGMGKVTARPAFSMTNVITVVAVALFLSFLAFWVWVCITPHR